jgi:hypothetical protein
MPSEEFYSDKLSTYLRVYKYLRVASRRLRQQTKHRRPERAKELPSNLRKKLLLKKLKRNQKRLRRMRKWAEKQKLE